MWERVIPIISHILSLVAFGFFCYAFATPTWFQGKSPHHAGDVTIGLWYVCQEISVEDNAFLDETLLVRDSWVCQAWSFPSASLEIIQGVASIVLLTCFLSILCFLPHTHRSIVILFFDSERSYETVEDRDHSHQLAYGASSLLLFASVGGIACLSMFVNYSRSYLLPKTAKYEICIILWCVGWILSLFSAIVGAHSIDDFEEYGQFTREENRQRYINEHLSNFGGMEDYEWWVAGDEERGEEEAREQDGEQESREEGEEGEGGEGEQEEEHSGLGRWW